MIVIPGELPRELTPRERGTLWLVALKLIQITNTTGHGTIHVYIRNREVDMVEGGDKNKQIPNL